MSRFRITRDIDRGWRRVMDEVRRHGPHVAVGILGAAGEQVHPGGSLSVAAIGAVHEFGLGNVPERSFIRGPVDAAKTQVQANTRRLADAVLLGRHTRRSALEVLGAWLKGLIQQAIAQGVPPPNEPSTVKRKGSSTPLIDTGQLRGSIDFEVFE